MFQFITQGAGKRRQRRRSREWQDCLVSVIALYRKQYDPFLISEGRKQPKKEDNKVKTVYEKYYFNTKVRRKRIEEEDGETEFCLVSVITLRSKQNDPFVLREERKQTGKGDKSAKAT